MRIRRAAAAGAALALCWALAGCGGEQETALDTAQVERRDLVESISATGTVTGREEEEVYTTLTGYEITDVLVEVGDRVSAGQVLCRLDVESIQDSLDTLNADIGVTQGQNALSVQSAQRQLQYAQDAAAAQTESAQVTVDQALEDLETAEADYAEAQDEYEDALTEEADCKKAFDKAEDAYADVKAEYDRRSSAYSTAAAQAEAFRAEKAQVDNEITKCSAKIKELEDKIAQAEAAGTDATALKNQLTEQETKLTQLQAQSAGLQDSYLRESAAAAELAVSLREYESTYSRELEEYNEANADYTQAQAEREAAEAALDAAESQVTARERSYEAALREQENAQRSAENSVAGQQESLRSAQLSTQANLNASYAQQRRYEEQLAEGQLSAAVSGVVTAVNIQEGSAYAGGAMVTIESDDTFQVETYVGEHEISDIREGMAVRIRTDATGEDVLQGTVTFVSPVAAAGAGTGAADYLVRVSVDSASDRLRLGMTARMSIELESRTGAVSVPYDALQTDAEGKYFLQVLEEDGSVREVDVEVGLASAYYVEVSGEGIEPGVTVVLPDTGSSSLEAMFDVMQGM
jgi:HlyD family secretion protein